MGFGGGFVITVAVVAAFVVAISHCAVVRSEEETESTFQVNLDCYLDVLDSGFPHGCDLNSLMFKCHDRSFILGPLVLICFFNLFDVVADRIVAICRRPLEI